MVQSVKKSPLNKKTWFSVIALPETNSSPSENWRLGDDPSLLGFGLFLGATSAMLVSGRAFYHPSN